ncbi:MAG: DUF3575 domain-containing protein [Bacteroidales bacterium]|nr:DUF3575 domain-containing protein [Bacteroidales bacterium]MBD5223233.1 DUF3575 domain-containing protein [Bacteroidales bacterium]MBD5348639.1 DUF3575 domain-containing protein [Bacteroides sp.]
MKIKHLLIAMLMLLPSLFSQAQTVGIKSNLLGDAMLSPNLGLEFGLAPKWTLDVSGEVNFWDVDNHRWRHWYVMPEARYWFCEKFAGHFIGLTGIAGRYDIGNLGKFNINDKFLGTDYHLLKDGRARGWGFGAGFDYGYAWPVAKHWNIEAEIGIGWIWTKYREYPSLNAPKSAASPYKYHNYVGLTKLAVNVEYLF